MNALLTLFNPVLLASAFGALTLFGLMFYLVQSRGERRSRFEIRKRLDIAKPQLLVRSEETAGVDKPKPRHAAGKIARATADYYANSDPKNQRKMQLQLIQAGYIHPHALGYFMAARIVLAFAFSLLALVLVTFVYTDFTWTNKMIVILLSASTGYFLPNYQVGSRFKKLQQENRGGFPDVMDLMVVAAEAGMTMEGSIERIAREIERTYPTLSRQLSLAALEIRAGRPLDQSLRAFGERLGLEEVQGFATMIQQSKELGTSVSDALRVYSDEMRHRRMMMAEEKAYALPAKLSIPVTAFIMPIVIGVAIMPTIVRMMNQ